MKAMDRVEAYLDSLQVRYGVRAVECVVLREHEVLLHFIKGTRDLAGKEPLTENHLHNVYSASKVLTATAVMQLVEHGKLGLDDELADYLPEFRQMRVLKDFDVHDFVASGKWLMGWPKEEDYGTVPANTPITIRQLLSMTAGFSYNILNPSVAALLAKNPHASTREIVSCYAAAPLLFQPGTHYSYSLAHDILVAVAEVVSGMKFSDYMRENLFAPLGATDIYYQIPAAEKYRVSELYAFDPETKEQKPSVENPARINDAYESGGAGVGCTVLGYSKVIDALANGGIGANGTQILKPETIRLMSENQLNERQLSDFHVGGKLEYGYALGVRTLLDPEKSESPLGEFGWDGAAGAYVLIDPKSRLSIFYVQEAPDSGFAFSEVHPTLRDLTYQAIKA